MGGIVAYGRHRNKAAKGQLKSRVTTEWASDVMQTHDSGCLLYFKHFLCYYLDMIKCVVAGHGIVCIIFALKGKFVMENFIKENILQENPKKFNVIIGS